MKMLFIILILIVNDLYSQEKYILSIGAIFQNESPYLQEWIEYHYEHGVEHFYLYNNNSTDDFKETLNPWIRAGVVELIQWTSIPLELDGDHFTFQVQTGAYDDAINRSKNVSKWLALIDIDEFIIAIKYDQIPDLLEKEYQGVSGLCVNWQCYGTSNIKQCKSVLHELVYKMRWNHEWNKHSKTICQPLHVSNCPNPHYCIYIDNHWAIDSNYNRCDICPNAVSIDKIRLNHYWTRDEKFLYDVKIARYKKWGVDPQSLIDHANSMNEEYDPILSNSGG